jgi:protein-tyrosine phosphatase
MAKIKIKVLSHYLFDEDMKQMGLNDANVENFNKAFISIIGTPECLKYYLDEGDTKHYFESHNNVLNLDFDDISTDVMYNGHRFKTMSMEQAEKTVEFIEEMVDRDVDEIKIHCRAGYSRSRAVAEFIYRYCNENGIEVEYEDRNDYTTMLNQGVLRRLNHAYWKKHKLNEYAEGDKDYPDDLINIPIKEINRERKKKTIENKQF